MSKVGHFQTAILTTRVSINNRAAIPGVVLIVIGSSTTSTKTSLAKHLNPAKKQPIAIRNV